MERNGHSIGKHYSGDYTSGNRNGSRLRTFGAGLMPADPPPAASPPADPVPAESATPARSKSFEVPIEVQVVYRGRVFTLRPTIRLSHLGAFCDRLDQIGATAPPRPVERDADGHPICPRHGQSMREREKQGDSWHSHVVLDGHGREHFCKGRPGSDSPGWAIVPGAASGNPG